MPSSDCQTALDLYKSSVELEVELRQATKSRSIFDRQVATLRSKLRDTYEKIIFLDYELAQSKEVEQNLWKYVYYKVIEDFRKKIRALPAPNGRSKSTSKKLTSSFRSFLHEATGFYYSFIQKLAVHFELKQLDPVIKKFGLTIEPTDVSQQFYSEDIKQRAVLSCHKSLIFLGDLARYRELHSDRINKNWSTACDYYNHARQLVPDSGNPHNQLAVIATYNSDDFLAVYHYYRSLVVKHQFLTAKDNISLLFHKAQTDVPEKETELVQREQEYGGKRRFSHQRQVSSSSSMTQSNNLNKLKASEAIRSFFADFIRLHSILYLKVNLESYSELKTSVLNQLKEYMLSRALEPDHLLKLTAINMAALYVIRLIANSENGNTNHSPKATSTYSQSSKKALVEKHSVLLVLDTLTTLLDMCNSELADVSIDGLDQKHNAVQILPAPVKRSLASLRVGAKWVYSRLDYIASMSTIISKDPNVKDEFINFARFWECFAEFLNAMEKLFPHGQGVPLDAPLKEDFELNGFLVLKDYISVDKNASENQGEPFEEVDMRIYDIFEDAKKISESESTQLFYYDGVFSAIEPPCKITSLVNVLSPTEHEIIEESYSEYNNNGPKAVADLIIDRDDANLAESQSFSSNSPKGKNSYTAEDDTEDEVILFTGRNSTIIDNDNLSSTGVSVSKKSSPCPIEKLDSPTTAEVLLSQVLNSNQHVTSSSTINKPNEQLKYWNHFNTPQLFPTTNNNSVQYDKLENKSVKVNSLDKSDYLTPVSRPSTTNPNGLLNTNTGAYNPTSFSSPTPVPGVPNASQDPLVPSTKRSLNDVKATLPYQNVATSSSASLFAFPGTDGGVSQFGLFGHSNSNSNMNGYSDSSSFSSVKPSMSTTVAAINPPPGFTADTSNFEMHKQGQQQNNTYQQSLFQTSNAFGFSSFDIMRTQFQWKNGSDYKLNGTPDNTMQINGSTGLAYQGIQDTNSTSAGEQNPDSLFWLTNTNITSSEKKGANGALLEPKATNDSRRYFSPGWTPASIG